MKTKKLAVWIFVLSITTMGVYGQDEVNTLKRGTRAPEAQQQGVSDIDLLSDSKSGSGISTTYLGIPGSMYLDDNFNKGKVVFSNETIWNDLMLRYNIYNQQMQYIKEDDTLAFAKANEIHELCIDDRTFVCTDFENDGVLNTGYFELLVSGECNLLLRRTVKYHLDGSGTENPYEEEYIKSSTLFYQQEGKPAQLLRSNKKCILKTFGDKEAEVNDFIKTNNLKMSSFQDIMMVVDFYNNIK